MENSVPRENIPKIESAEYKQGTIKHCAQCVTIYGFKCGCVLTLSHVRHFVTLWTVAHRAPLPMAMLQAGILEWVVISCSRRSSRPRDAI